MLGNILDRFRARGVPGAAAPAGMPPTDRSRALELELAPVLSALERTQARAGEVLALGSERAAACLADAVEEGQLVVGAAQARAGETRLATIAEYLQGVDLERDRVIASGRAEVERIAAVVAARTPALAERLVRQVLEIGLPWPPGSSDGRQDRDEDRDEDR